MDNSSRENGPLASNFQLTGKTAASRGESGLSNETAVVTKLIEGDNKWPAVMKILDHASYSGWTTSEQPGTQAADVETARDLAQRMDRIFAL